MRGFGLAASAGVPKKVIRDLTLDKVRPINVRDLCCFEAMMPCAIHVAQMRFRRFVESLT
jgi:hypothetical protein